MAGPQSSDMQRIQYSFLRTAGVTVHQELAIRSSVNRQAWLPIVMGWAKARPSRSRSTRFAETLRDRFDVGCRVTPHADKIETLSVLVEANGESVAPVVGNRIERVPNSQRHIDPHHPPKVLEGIGPLLW